MRRLATLIAALAWAAPAKADCGAESHLATCFDADTFFPHPGAGYFDFIGSAATTPRGEFALGLATTYLSRPVVLVIPSSDPNGTEVAAVDHLVDSTLLFSFGLTDRLDLGLALPVAAYRTGLGLSAVTSQRSAPIAHAAMRDVRAGAGFRFFGCPAGTRCDDRFGLAGRFELALPTGDESSFAGDRSLVAIPTLSAEWRGGPLVAGAEFGGRFRGTSDLAGSRVGSQLVFAAALGAEIIPNTFGVFLQAIALPTLLEQHDLSFDGTSSGRVVSGSRPPLVPAEWQAGVRTSDVFVEGASISFGAGSAIPFSGESALTAPRYRVLLSLRYAPRPGGPVCASADGE